MIKTRKDLKEYIRCDRVRNCIGGNFMVYLLKLVAGVENAHVVRYLRNLRKTEYYKNQKSILYKPLYYWCYFRHLRLSMKYNIRLNPNVAGKGIRIMHLAGGGGAFLNANSIGENCGFNSGVLLGNKDSEDARPTIGDHVAFGPGAKAIGKLHIGDNCFIAANAVVVKDMPANAIIAGVPAKVIKLKEKI